MFWKLLRNINPSVTHSKESFLISSSSLLTRESPFFSQVAWTWKCTLKESFQQCKWMWGLWGGTASTSSPCTSPPPCSWSSPMQHSSSTVMISTLALWWHWQPCLSLPHSSLRSCFALSWTLSLLAALVPCLQKVILTTPFFSSFFAPVLMCSCVSYYPSLLQTSNSLPKTSYFKLVDIWLFFSIVIIFVVVMLQTLIDYSQGKGWFTKCLCSSSSSPSSTVLQVSIGFCYDQ